jgi:RHS repeat-associated protein
MGYDPDSGNLSQKGELHYRCLDSTHSHAVTAVSDGWRYEYDPNGNLVRKAYRPGLYFPLVLLTEPEETLGEPPESQAEPTSPYPPVEEQSRAEPGGLLAWLHSAWDFIGRLFGSGRQTALAAGLQQDDPTPIPTPDPSPPEPPEEIEYSYDAENRLVSVSAGEMQASFVYDGDGQRVASVIAGAATVYIGEVFEWEVTASSMRRYYYAGAQRVAIRTGSASPVWLLGDHLGSTSVAANTDGSLLSRQGYLPWGELRFTEGSLPGRYQFTGQASYEAEFGLYYYKARWYDAHLGRFSQPDSIVPLATQGVQAFDRYAYANNNPVRYADPSGHWIDTAIDVVFIGYDIYDIYQNGLNRENGLALAADVVGAILPGVTGGGVILRAAMRADDVGDAVRKTNNALTLSEDALKYGKKLVESFDDKVHHLASNKNKMWTPVFNDLVQMYGKLDESWNKLKVPQNSKHPEQYHRWVADALFQIDLFAQGDREKFLELFEKYIMNTVNENPWLLKKAWWEQYGDEFWQWWESTKKGGL